MRDSREPAGSGDRFPSDYDQAPYHEYLRQLPPAPHVNLSLKWSYGSGFPIPGYLRMNGASYYLTSSRNQLRLDPYQRADFRINKSWTKDK